MPNFTKFLEGDSAILPAFLNAAQKEMADTTIDRFSNAFEMLNQGEIFENLTRLSTEYIALFQFANVDTEEMSLSTQSANRINQFVDKLLSVSSYELLNDKGQLREEVVVSLKVNALCEKIKKSELSQDYSETIKDIQKEFLLTEEDAIRKMVTDAFVKGFTSAIIMSMVRMATEANALTVWRDENPDNKITEAVVNGLINKDRTNPVIIQRNITNLIALQQFATNPEIVKHTIADNNFYKMNLQSYIYTTLVGAVSAIQKLFTDATKAKEFTQLIEAKQYRAVVSNYLGSLLNEVTKPHLEVDTDLISSIIKAIREETKIFFVSQQSKSSNLFKSSSASTLNEVFTVTKNVEILALNYFRRPNAEVKLDDPNPSR
jgi:hypothetical protein